MKLPALYTGPLCGFGHLVALALLLVLPAVGAQAGAIAAAAGAVGPVAGDSAAPPALRREPGISLQFSSADIRAVLQAIADFAGVSIVAAESVAGTVSLRLSDVPWQQALELVLASRDLDQRRIGDLILVAPRDELLQRERQAQAAEAQRADVEPLVGASIQLHYQRAEAARAMLADQGNRILSRRGVVLADARTNRIFVQDTAARLAEVRRLVADTDIPVRQVMIEARIVEAVDTFGRNLGARLGINDLSNARGQVPGLGGRTRVLPGGGLPGAAGVAGQSGQYDLPDNPRVEPPVIGNVLDALDRSLMVNLPAAAIRGAAPGAFSLALFNAGLTRFLNLEVSALEADGRGRVVSSPRVIAADQEEAAIEQGSEVPFQLATSSGATAVTFKKATLSLRVRPQITPDGHIIMNLRINKDSPNFANVTAFGPPIDTKQIQTQVRVQNGGTVVIGGILTESEQKNRAGVPWLASLPGLGRLFRSSSQQSDKTELLIFVTPRIVEQAPLVPADAPGPQGPRE
ncbi:MAG: type IV pilus secretin PilQ [Rhodocyclaceae bacterium]|nr:type IV pilus secretin PilQ [Rhodocyclaceae bacterium]